MAKKKQKKTTRKRKRSKSSSSRKSQSRKATVKRILNCIPSAEVDKDWSIENAVDSGMLMAAPAIPARKDLRESWWSIGDQGATGSCVGWATGDSVLRYHFVKAGRLAKTEPLSVRQLWMSAKETDIFDQRPTTFIETDGTSLKAALDVARKFGCVTDTVLPFASGNLYPRASRTFYAIAAQRKIASYINLGRDPNYWRQWLATQGPILTRLNIDKSWNKATANGGDLDIYLPILPGGGHAIALVGYTEDRFIVRNSWGTTWGDQGFAYASDGYAIEAFTEAYGVSI